MSFWKDRTPLDRFRVVLIIAASALAATVAGLAFWVSFEAISAYVVRIGALPRQLRYAGPLLVDSFTVLATVFLLWLALAGKPLRKEWDAYYAWVLIIAATAASAYLNAAHVAADAADVARVVAGAVPVTLLASVHLLVLLLLRLLAWTPVKPAPVLPPAGAGERVPESPPRQPASRVPAQAPAPAPRVGPPPSLATRGALPSDRSSDRARAVREHLNEHPGASEAKVKAMLRERGIPPGNSQRLHDLVAGIKAEGNGSAPKVEVEA